MKMRRRTAAWICVAAFVASLGVTGWVLSRPARLRAIVQSALQGSLAAGWEVEIDDVRFVPLERKVGVLGLRVVKVEPSREVVVRIPKLVVESGLWDLFGHFRLSSVRVEEPEILLEVTADGRIPLFEAFPGGDAGAAPGARPKIRVDGGSVRVRAAGILAEGEEARVQIEFFEWLESRDGSPTFLDGAIRETGSLRDGKGALGRMVVQGEMPPARKGFKAGAEKVTWDDALLARLSPEWREKLSLVSMKGNFGSGPDDPGLTVTFERPPGSKALKIGGTLRPRGVDLRFKAFPLPFTRVVGDIVLEDVLNDGAVRIDSLMLRYKNGSVHARGRAGRLHPDTPFQLEFWAREFPVDADLREVLPPGVQNVLDAYGFNGFLDITLAPTGAPGSFDSFLRRSAGGPLDVSVSARVLDGSMSYKGYADDRGVRQGFDYPLDRLSGGAKVLVEGGKLEVSLLDLRGFHGKTAVRANGTVEEWHDRAAASIAIDVEEIALDETVRRATPAMEGIWKAWSPRGIAKHVRVDIIQVPGVDPTAHEAVTVELDGRAGFTWSGLPLPMDRVSGHVRYGKNLLDGKREPIYEVQEVRAEADGAVFTASGTVEGNLDARLHIDVRAEAVRLDGALARAAREAPIPAAVAILDALEPKGSADLTVIVSGRESATRASVRVDLHGASIEGYGDVRFPVTGLTGAVELRPETGPAPEEVSLAAVRGTWEGREVRLEGSVLSPSTEPVLNLRVLVPDAPLDEESLRGILGPAAGGLQGYFDFVRPAPGFRGNAEVRLQGPAKALDPAVTVDGIRGGAAPMQMREFEVTGGRVAYAGGSATMTDMTGTLAGKEFRVPAGRAHLGPGEGSLNVQVRGLRFPRDFEGLLPPETVAAVAEVFPDRNIHMEDLHVALSEGFRRVQLDGTVTLSPMAAGAQAGINLEGDFRLDRVVLARAAEPDSPTALSGSVEVSRGSFVVGPAGVKDMRGMLDLRGSLGSGGEGVSASLRDCSAHVENWELRGASGEISLRDGVFTLAGLKGDLAGGELFASVEVGGRGKGTFEGNAVLSRASAGLLLSPTDPESKLRGKADLNVTFANRTGADNGLTGKGKLEIAKAKLFKVPIFDTIYGLVGKGGQTPEFETAIIEVELKGDRIDFERIDIESDVVAIYKATGRSSLWYDGQLRIKLIPEVKALTPGVIGWVWDTLVNPVIKPIKQRVYSVYVVGTRTNPQVSFEVFDFLFAPGTKGSPRFKPPPRATTVQRRPAWDF